MRMILIVIGLCALSLAGRAQSSVLVSDMGYNSELNEFYFILDNFTEYALSIYPLKTESLDIINRDKTFRNGTYAFYRLKDKNGTVIKSSGPCWWKKGYDYFVLPRAKECYPLANRTFLFWPDDIPERAYTMEVDLYLKLFNIEGYRGKDAEPFHEEKISEVIQLR